MINIGGIIVRCSEAGRAVWKTAVQRAMNVQLQDMEKVAPVLSSETPVSSEIVIRDYQELEMYQAESLVPGAYRFAKGILVDLKKRRGLRIQEGVVEYWCHSTLGLSLPFLIQMALAATNKTFVHAAAFSVEGKGLLLPAFGGIGKTFIVGRAVREKGVKMLGDDLVILSKSGYVFPYARPFCLYRYHRSVFSQYYRDNRPKYLWPGLLWKIYFRIVFELDNRVGITLPRGRYVTYRNGYITDSPANIITEKKIATAPVPLEKVILLRRSERVTSIRVKVAKCQEAVGQFAANVTLHEWAEYHKFICSYMAHMGQSIGSYFKNTEKIVIDAFEKANNILVLDTPPQISGDKLFSTVMDIALK